ncbi:hypothetical protein QO002_003742 [Pararhizobium capsulatum DSM 1112]|uniref:Uncharacterized protein n=1 Tax=Pararhizobium capsulatum DSM 1112 TaxID=1121113 RepID=A0ABU0BTM3_9HYPH|nr:hypothetical protein [Pararhizobium capsulatum DSM 1112]
MANIYTNQNDIAINIDDLFGVGDAGPVGTGTSVWNYFNSENQVQVTFSGTGANTANYNGSITSISLIGVVGSRLHSAFLRCFLPSRPAGHSLLFAVGARPAA